jgi:flagellar hook-length control protein FliK
VLALRAGGDGTHQLIVALHPAELGAVNLHVRIENNTMTIRLASGAEAHATLHDALPQLRSELQSAGLGGVELSLELNSGAAGSGAFADQRRSAPDPGRPARAAPIEELAGTEGRRRVAGERAGSHASAGLDRWL